MLTFSLFLFAAVLLVLAVAAVRGLSRIDDILEVVEPGDADPASFHPALRAEG